MLREIFTGVSLAKPPSFSSELPNEIEAEGREKWATAIGKSAPGTGSE